MATFHRDEFIQNEVLTGNLTIDEANKVLEEAGQPKINPTLGKLATQNWLSPTLSGVGIAAGLPLAIPTFGATSAFGGLGGYGLGEMLKTEAGNLSGIAPLTGQPARDRLGNSITNAAGAGLVGQGLGDLLMLANFISHPIRSLSSAREKIWNKSEPISEEQALKKLSSAESRSALPENKQATSTMATDLYSKWFPGEGTVMPGGPAGTKTQSTEPLISKLEAFKRLKEWEDNNKVWTNENPMPLQKQALQNVSSEARGLLRGNDIRIGALNSAIGTLEKLQPYKRLLIGGGLAIPILRSAYFGIVNALSQDKSK